MPRPVRGIIISSGLLFCEFPSDLLFRRQFVTATRKKTDLRYLEVL